MRLTSAFLAADARCVVFDVVQYAQHYRIKSNVNPELIGYLEQEACQALLSLGSIAELRFQGVLASDKGKQPQRSPGRGTEILTLSINTYGSLAVTDKVGVILTKRKTVLQHPYLVHADCKGYFNPQLLGHGG
jgi:hypothetical protein